MTTFLFMIVFAAMMTIGKVVIEGIIFGYPVHAPLLGFAWIGFSGFVAYRVSAKAARN